uniref:Uncharacterized protein n=1 Tax=Timema poppense TaxID=170557 RepID=A0A7R9DUH1_TIMPO|nr:unnamed protein product [Timema poppensis]
MFMFLGQVCTHLMSAYSSALIGVRGDSRGGLSRGSPRGATIVGGRQCDHQLVPGY